MKIDFNATYKNISALLQAGNRPKTTPQSDGEFGSLLGTISPDAPKTIEKPAKNALIEQALTNTTNRPTDALAALNLSKPELRQPKLEPFDRNLVLEPPVKAQEHSVKSPTLLEARRVNVYAGLDGNARAQAVHKLVTQYGKELGIDPSLGMAVASVESSFNPVAVSSDGHASKGLFQLLDRTGQDLHTQSSVESEYNPFNPDQNTMLGMSYLRKLHDIFSQKTELPNKLQSVAAANSSSLEKLAVAAYNAGEGRVASAQERASKAGLQPGTYESIEPYLPKSTREYVAKVMQVKGQFNGGSIVATEPKL